MKTVWEELLASTRLLPSYELRRITIGIRENGHRCENCFSCACLAALRNRAVGETTTTKGGITDEIDRERIALEVAKGKTEDSSDTPEEATYRALVGADITVIKLKGEML